MSKSLNKDAKRRKRKFKDRLPNEVIVIKNEDKQSHEKWYKGRNIAAFPRPFRAILCSGVNSGKTNLVKNILLRQKWDRIMLVPVDRRSKEWRDFDISDEDIFDDIPPVSEFEHDNGKQAIILEDYEAGTPSKQGNLSKLFRYVSTHCNVSVFLLYQDMMAVPKIARRISNIFVVWPMVDKRQTQIIGNRVGCEPGELEELLDTFCKKSYDNICFDLTKESPYPLRLNIFQPIHRAKTIKED